MAFTQNQTGATTSYGTIWMNTASWSGVSFSATTAYKELGSLSTSFTLVSPNNDYSMGTDGRLAYTGAQDRKFMVSGFFSTTASASIAIAAYKNGTLITGTESYNIDFSSTLVPTAVSLSNGDYVSLFMKRSANASITILQITLSITSLINA